VDAERWQRVQELFDGAVERPPEERAGYLAEECGSDDELRREVEAMLAADRAGGTVVDAAIGGAAQLLTDPITARGVFGKYEIVEKIGEGGFGQVHKGRDPHLRRTVAIKSCTSIDPELRQRFFREAQIAASLQHPNIVTVHELGFEEGIPFLVQEFLSGEDLEQKIARRDPTELTTRLDYLLQVARGLAHAHRQGVLHRDVKPANVRVLDSGEVKILDFGIAHLLDQSTRFTGTGVTLGTVGYLAPEQLEGGDVDRRADVFSFGVLAYELLGYQRPFRGDTLSQISYQLVAKEPPPLRELCPECPPALETIVERCLRKDPGHRYPTLEPVIADLERVVERLQAGDEAQTILLPTTGQTTRRRRRSVPWLAGGAVAVALALLALWRTGDDAPPPSAAEPATEIEVAQSAPPKPAEPPADPPGPGENPESNPEPPASPQAATEPPPPPEEPPPPAVQETEPEPPPPELSPQVDEAEVGTEPSPAEAEEPAPPPEKTEPPPPPPPPPPPNPDPTDELQAEEPAPATATEDPPTETQPESAGLITPGPGVVEPELVDRPQPRYPERAQRRKKEAQVVVAVLVSEQGGVVRALVKQATVQGYGFEQAALTAARRARFRPATRDGVPGRMWTEVSFDFRLE